MQPQPVATADVYPLDALRNDVPSSRILSAGNNDDMSQPISTARTAPVAFPSGAGWRDTTLESRFWASIGSEKSYKLVSCIGEAGRIFPWEKAVSINDSFWVHYLTFVRINVAPLTVRKRLKRDPTAREMKLLIPRRTTFLPDLGMLSNVISVLRLRLTTSFA